MFDSYVWRARLAPATLALAPLVTLGLHLDGEPWGKLVPAGVLAVVVFLVGEAVRRAGRRLEVRLIANWGGMPTTRMLRASPSDSSQETRRGDVQRVSGVTLPDAMAQRDAPDASDSVILSAVRSAVITMRADGPDRNLMASENASYGFARNSAALKPAAIVLAVAVLALHSWAMVWGAWAPSASESLFAFGAPSLIFILWVTAIGKRQVKEQAEIYALHFFATLRSFSAAKAAA